MAETWVATVELRGEGPGGQWASYGNPVSPIIFSGGARFNGPWWQLNFGIASYRDLDGKIGYEYGTAPKQPWDYKNPSIERMDTRHHFDGYRTLAIYKRSPTFPPPSLLIYGIGHLTYNLMRCGVPDFVDMDCVEPITGYSWRLHEPGWTRFAQPPLTQREEERQFSTYSFIDCELWVDG
jgi:hypothetical protein